MDVTNEVHSNDVLRELNDLRKRAELTDVVLVVEGRCFPCHRAVLASCSPYFRGMFTSGYAEAKQERISIQDVSAVAMATFLDYAYTGCLQTEPDQAQAVMSAARIFQVDFVGRKAAEYMKDHLNVFNCVDVLMYADMLGDCGLVEASKTYMASRFDKLALHPTFVQLPLNHLQSLLDRDDLMTNLEDNVVQAALRWVHFNLAARLQHLPALSRSLRQSLISSTLLVEMESKLPSTWSKLVYSDSSTQRLGHVRTELQIFLREGNDFHHAAPCYDPSAGQLYAIKMPESMDSFSRSVTVTPDNQLYMSCDIVTRKGWEVARRQKNFYQYNHLLNTWQPRCAMITPRVRCGLVYLKGHIYAIAGDETKRTAERYDPSCDKWTSIPPIPRPVSSKFCAVTLDDSIYVITNKGCCSFSTTKNKWKRRASMLHKPLRPQAVTYQGRIYCIDGDENSQCCPSVEMYNPTTREWKQCGNGSYSFSKATLMVHGETMYLLTILDMDHEDLWDEEEEMGTGVAATYIYKYQPETDLWLEIKQRSPRGKLFPPLAEWLSEGSWVDCLTARMIPMCLGDPKDYKGDHDGGEYPMSPSSRISDYSDRDDLSDQENSDLDEDMY